MEQKVGRDNSLLVVDLDGTVVYRSDTQDIKELYRVTGDHGVMAHIELDGKRYCALVAENGTYCAYMSLSTVDRLRTLQQTRPIVCATGSPYTTILARRHMLAPFANSIIFETGTRILHKMDDDLVPDLEWESRFEGLSDELETLAHQYAEDGFDVDRRGRRFTLRIRHGIRVPPYHLSPGFTHTHNLGHLDVIPRYAGKQRAIEYVCEKYGCDGVTYIGDDYNDYEPLNSATRAFVMRHASPDVIAEAVRKGWSVTSKRYIEGIDGTLSHLLDAG